MQHVLIIHEVESYSAWKAVFDQAADMRKQAGEISYQLLRYDNHAKPSRAALSNTHLSVMLAHNR